MVLRETLLGNLSEQIVVIRDAVLGDCVHFLNQCEGYGKIIKALIESPLELETLNSDKNTVAHEAKTLKFLLSELYTCISIVEFRELTRSSHVMQISTTLCD